MLKLRNINLLGYLSIFLLLVYSSASNAYFRSSYAELHMFLILIAISSVIKNGFKISKPLFYILLIWLLYNVLYLTIYGVFSLNAMFYTPILLISSQIIFNINKNSLLQRIGNTIFFFALVSLIFYSLQIINFNLVAQFIIRLQNNLGIGGLEHGHTYGNIIIYTISDLDSGFLGLRRNCGFLWEPGGFATILNTGLFINLHNNGYKLIDFKILIITIALLTTFSTTGYLGLLIVFSYYIFKRKKLTLSFVFRLSLLILLFILLLKSQFVLEKINYRYKSGIELTYIDEESKFTGSLGRFAGLAINIKEFLNRPLLGHYFDDAERIVKSGYNASINGLGNLLARHGIILFIFYLVGYYKSSSLFTHDKVGSYFFFSLLLINAFAFNLVRSPYFMLFFTLGFIVNKHFIFDKRINENLYYNQFREFPYWVSLYRKN